MKSYGEEAATRLMDENAVITMAALDGNLEALSALLSLASQQAYAAGMAAAANALGLPL